MKNILLLTDFSENAWNATFTATKLFHDVKAKFYILHTFEPSMVNLLGDKSKERLASIYSALSSTSNKELDKILEYLEDHHDISGHSFEKISTGDELISAVKEVLPAKDIDLIVMGTKGATGAKKIFLGSNAVRVIGKIKSCPIIAVPQDFHLQELKRIVLPTDYSRPFDKYELQPLVELAKLWNAKVEVIWVAEDFIYTDEQVMHKKLLEKRLAEVTHSFGEVSFKKNISKSIMGYANSTKADLIAMLQYDHSILDHILKKPVIKRIGYGTHIPFMILPDME